MRTRLETTLRHGAGEQLLTYEGKDEKEKGEWKAELPSTGSEGGRENTLVLERSACGLLKVGDQERSGSQLPGLCL